ncbi:MAG: hypothetical protein JWN27_2943 [Candidatus Eremiobacteraeota bacterium]|nr:hypothetical protein [Candidatus Eremiobacteraeota bacterium]
MGLFDPDDRDRAVSRALLSASIIDKTDMAALNAGLGLTDEDAFSAELAPFANAIYAAQLAWRGVSDITKRRLADPRRDLRVRTASGFLDGAEAVNPLPIGGTRAR